MDGRKYQRKSGIRRTLVMLLALVMLASVCFPAMRVNAEETLECTCGTESEIHTADCPKYVAPQNGGEGDTQECNCNAENGVHTEGCPKYVAPQNDVEGETKECTCNAENGVHTEGCPKYVAPKNDVEGDTQECNCNAENGVHIEGCPKYVAPQNGGEGDTQECNCNAENGVHADSCPKYVAPKNDDEEPSMSDAAKAYLKQIEDIKAQIENLDPDASDYEDKWRRIFDDLIIIQQVVSTDWEEDILSDDEFETICNAAEALKVKLGDPYDATTYADDPQMKYYNKDNRLAYDVARTDTSGYNDTSHTYVSSVKLGGVNVTQANSNSGYDVTWYPVIGSYDTRVGQKLSSYYGGLDTGDAVTNKTLVITPAPGYYVTQVVVACCDGGKPYNCGTWAEDKAFNRRFNVSAGGDLSVELPSSAFGHGASYSLESRDGEEQYFILIKVAPVPTPLYIEYTYGAMDDIMGDDFSSSVFNDPSEWTAVGGSNLMGTGRIDTHFTRYQYQYETGKPGDVAKWKHFANTVTNEAKAAAAAKGYYFAGWEATYYTECDSRYNFSNEYSEKTTHYDEGAQVSLITNVKLIAQWAPIPMKVTKTVTGLPDNRANSYSIQVYKDGVVFGEKLQFSVTGNNSSSLTVKDSSGNIVPVTPGTYTVEEDECDSITVGDKTYNVLTTTTELTVSASDTNRTYELLVTNAYSDVVDSVPDPTYIMIQKTFVGLPVDKIPNDFTITITADNGTTTTTLTKNTATISSDGLVWQWLVAQPSGTYSLTEAGYDPVDGYEFQGCTGLDTVTTVPSTISLDTINNVTRGDENQRTLDAAPEYLVASLTQGKYFVWTAETLSVNQRKGFLEQVHTRMKYNPAPTLENTVFFSGKKLEDTLSYRGGTVKYDKNTKILSFTMSKQWNMFAYGDYTITHDSADVQVTNTYEASTTTITITKTVSGNMGDQSKEFTFTYKVGATGTERTFTLKHGGSQTLENLKIGETLYIKEATDYVKTVTYTVTDGDETKTITAEEKDGWYQIPVAAGTVVNFNNTKNATIDTGITTDSIPYILLLTMAVIGAGALLMKKRRAF